METKFRIPEAKIETITQARTYLEKHYEMGDLNMSMYRYWVSEAGETMPRFFCNDDELISYAESLRSSRGIDDS